MSVKVLVDTSILVSIYDPLDSVKQKRAIAVMDRLITTTRAVISPQIMGEFFMATTRVSRPLLTSAEAINCVQNYIASCEVVTINPLIALEALRGFSTHDFQFWEAQIWATARLNQITNVYSEDFNSGVTVEGIKFTNPLSDEFALP
jgi:predicted nucleic acid-binding protein